LRARRTGARGETRARLSRPRRQAGRELDLRRGSARRRRVLVVSADAARAGWTAVDEYFAGKLIAPDPVLAAVLASNAAAGLPPENVSPNQGQLLQILARAVAARSILEVGTHGGYSTIWLARTLPPGGRLITLEIDAARAELARANVARAGLASIVDVRCG